MALSKDFVRHTHDGSRIHAAAQFGQYWRSRHDAPLDRLAKKMEKVLVVLSIRSIGDLGIGNRTPMGTQGDFSFPNGDVMAWRNSQDTFVGSQIPDFLV
jgi:hypothetical protein